MSSKPLIGIVKQVTSGDTIVIRDKPIDKSPNEITIRLSRVKAPKLGRKGKDRETKDEPYAWEAREFLRKKLIGQEVKFIPIPKANEDIKHEIGKVYFPKDDENNDIARELVANGLARVDSKSNNPKTPEDVKKLFELEEKAKQEKKGQWNKENSDKHIRNIKYVSDYKKFVSEYGNKPMQAIVEQVRNDRNAYMILDVMILPHFYSIPFALSGLNFNDSDDNCREESKFFVECRLLQQENVRIVVEKALKSYVLGTVLHPKGSIAELLLQEGFAYCDDQTLPMTSEERIKLRNAEKSAKEKKLRIWKNKPILPGTKKKEFQGTVTEIIGGDAMMVKLSTGETKKIFLASIRSPREARREPGEEKTRQARTLFDVPWLYEAREFLRTKLIGKKVNVTVDFEQPPKEDDNGRSLPEKLLCTVLVGGVNIAEQLVQNGLATVISNNRQGQEEKNRSSQIDALVIAENKAKENHIGLHSKGEPPKHKVSDCVGNRAAGLFPLLQKASRIDAIVEYVMSGSKMRLFIPKDSFMITFLLSGISCPRAGTLSGNRTGKILQADPYGDEALNFTKDKILQRKVEIRIESMDKFGNMIGSLFIGNTNLALGLVEEGLASVHPTCSDRTFMQAEKVAKTNKINMWANYEEDAKKDTNEDDVKERTFNYKDIIVTVVAPDLHVYAHHVEEKKAYTEIGDKLRQEFSSNSPACCSKEKPPVRGKLYAAKYTDNEWYRGKVEKTYMSSGKAFVNYVDYGNRETVLFEDLAPLPDSCAGPKPFAHEYGLACVQLPPDHYKEDVVQELIRELADRNLRINVEYYEHNFPYVSITDPETNEDCIKTCIAKGLFYAQKRREKKLHSLIDEYLEAQNEAQKKRLLIWEYGDARDDDAKEFGLGK